jgi:drug/metabolite transporter (DMT)-like permease
VRGNLHWYIALAVIVGGLFAFLQDSVLLGDALVVAGSMIWSVGYSLHTRRLRESRSARG